MKRAFTVAEVIITLFIIATVATMTIPAIQKELKTNEPQVKQQKQCCPCSYDYDFTKQ